MKLLCNLFLALVTSLSVLGPTIPAGADPHAASVHTTLYYVYWRYTPNDPWVQLPYTYASYGDAYNATAWLANTYNVETYIRWYTS